MTTGALLEPYLSANDLRELFQEPGRARGLPAAVYRDPNFFELERKEIFAKSWVGIGFDSDVPNPGDVVPVSYAGWELLLARDHAGEVRCFHNICRHRGMKLCAAPRQGVHTLSCPWHRWTYGLDGRLQSTPNLGGPRAGSVPDIAREEHGLVAIRSASWMGVVFVNLDAKAPNLDEHLAPIRERLKSFDLSLARQSDLGMEITYDANWKLVIEGGIEDYHIVWVHSQLGPGGAFSPELGGATYAGISSRREVGVGEKRHTLTGEPPPGAKLPNFPHIPTRGQAETSVILTIFPHTLIGAQMNHVVMSLFMPVSATQTRIRRRFSFVGDATTDASLAAQRRMIRDSWQLISEQDSPIVAQVQQLTKQRGELALKPRFSPFWEPAVHHFQKMVVARLGAA